MKKVFFSSLFCSLLVLCGNAADVIPDGWWSGYVNFDEGNSGSVTSTEVDGKVNIKIVGQGKDIWGQTDYGYQACTPLIGDGEIAATVSCLDTNLYSYWARAGLQFRASSTPNAAVVMTLRAAGSVTDGSILKCQTRLTDNGWTGNWTGAPDDKGFHHGDGIPMRLRMVRQGNLISAFFSTNAPTYDVYELYAQQRVPASFPVGVNAGLIVSRYNKNKEDYLTVQFDDVVVRQYVTAVTNEAGIAVTWLADAIPLATNETVAGWVVSRAGGNAETFVELGSTNQPAWLDLTADAMTRWRYRIDALVESVATNGVATTQTVHWTTSLPVRRTSISENPNPSALRGIAANYYDKNWNFLSSRVEPQLYDGWLSSGNAVYPVNAANGLPELQNFKARWNGTLTVPESGMYGFRQKVDDVLAIFVNGQIVIQQFAWHGGLLHYSAPMWLEAGKSYSIAAEFHEGTGGEWAQLEIFKDNYTTAQKIPQAWLAPFPYPWNHDDLGANARPGNMIYSETDSTFTAYSSGRGFGRAEEDSDEMQWMWEAMSYEDRDLVVKIDSLSGATAEAGLTARAKLDDADSPFAVHASFGVRRTEQGYALEVISRATNHAETVRTTLVENITLPVKLRFALRDDAKKAYLLYDTGAGWVIASSTTNAPAFLSETHKVGCWLAAGTSGEEASARFTDLSLVTLPRGQIAVTVADGAATVKPGAFFFPNEVRRNNAASSLAGWSWADALTNTAAYTVYRTDNVVSNGNVVGTFDLAKEEGFTDVLGATNTVVAYRLGKTFDYGPMVEGETNTLQRYLYSYAYGVSDGQATTAGTGLYFSYFRDAPDGVPTNTPSLRMIDTFRLWEPASDKIGENPYLSASTATDGIQVGPYNFGYTALGYLTPNVSGWYQFEVRHDDRLYLYVNDIRVYASTSYKPSLQYTTPIWLASGVSVPIFVTFRQGGGGGSIRLYWRNGMGASAESFTSIPKSNLTPFTTVDAPLTVSAESDFGQAGWKNQDVNTKCPGLTTLVGTPACFDAHLSAAGGDFWGKEDGFHFLWQEMKPNWEFSLEANVSGFDCEQGWAKLGLCLRESLEKGARNYTLLQTPSNGRVLQRRIVTNNDSSNQGATPEGSAFLNGGKMLPVHFRVTCKAGVARFYINGQEAQFEDKSTISVEDWSGIYVGLGATSHDVNRLSHFYFTDVQFSKRFVGGSVLIIR